MFHSNKTFENVSMNSLNGFYFKIVSSTYIYDIENFKQIIFFRYLEKYFLQVISVIIFYL